jgi:hypothetical protein
VAGARRHRPGDRQMCKSGTTTTVALIIFVSNQTVVLKCTGFIVYIVFCLIASPVRWLQNVNVYRVVPAGFTVLELITKSRAIWNEQGRGYHGGITVLGK